MQLWPVIVLAVFVATPVYAQPDSLGGHWASPDLEQASGAVTRAAFNTVRGTFRASFADSADVEGTFVRTRPGALGLHFDGASAEWLYSVRIDTLSVTSLTGDRRLFEGPVLTLVRSGQAPVRLAYDPDMMLASVINGYRMGRMMAALSTSSSVGAALSVPDLRLELLDLARRHAREAQRLSAMPPAFGGKALADVTFAALGTSVGADGGVSSVYGTAYLRTANPCRGVATIPSGRSARLFVLTESRARDERVCVAIAGPEASDVGEVAETIEAP